MRDPKLGDTLTGPVLGLYTHLVHCSRMIRCRIKRRGNKRPYIKQGSGWNLRIVPKIARGGAIFLAPLGVVLTGGHIHLMNVASLVGPLFMQGIIIDILEVCTAILSGNLKKNCDQLGPPDPLGGYPFHNRGRQMRAL